MSFAVGGYASILCLNTLFCWIAKYFFWFRFAFFSSFLIFLARLEQTFSLPWNSNKRWWKIKQKDRSYKMVLTEAPLSEHSHQRFGSLSFSISLDLSWGVCVWFARDGIRCCGSHLSCGRALLSFARRLSHVSLRSMLLTFDSFWT